MESSVAERLSVAARRGVSARSVLLEQCAANRSALGCFEGFFGHRAELTRRVLCAGRGRERARLCVLGAGNCFDLELSAVAEMYAEVHLVDIDGAALEVACSQVQGSLRARLFCHAEVELSGVVHALEQWRALVVTVEDALALPATASRDIASQLPGPFDVVVSACLLTQLQLAVVQLLTDSHPLFEAARHTTNVIHLRTLQRLTAPRGTAILATDVTSDELCGLSLRSRADADLGALLQEVQQTGRLFHAVSPRVLTLTHADDPVLWRELRRMEGGKPWLWQNGPERTFLVYALEFERVGGD